MPAQLLDISQFADLSVSAVNLAPKTGKARLYEFPSPATPQPEHLNCCRGIRLAVVLELAAGVLAYSLWLCWHAYHIAHAVRLVR